MNCIKVVFEIRINGHKFPEISFSDTTPEYKNVTLVPSNSNNSHYEIWVEKNISAGSNIKTIVQEATTEAQTFVYVFSVSAKVKIFEFACKGYRQNNSLISIEHMFGGSGAKWSGQLIRVVGADDITQIKQGMKQNYDLSKLQLFFDSATIVEPIGRFISLYTLMLHYCSDDQKKVDEAIVSIDSTVAQSKSPKVNRYETVFTKLRNELSHKRDGVIMIETHNRIRDNVDRFEYIVKCFTLSEALR